MSAVLRVTDEGYGDVINGTDVPVLLVFSAAWCAPCRAMEPLLEEIASEHAGKVAVGKVNVDESPHVAMEFDVMSIPTILVFASGHPVKKLVGQMSKTKLLSELAPWLAR